MNDINDTTTTNDDDTDNDINDNDNDTDNDTDNENTENEEADDNMITNLLYGVGGIVIGSLFTYFIVRNNRETV